MTEGITKEKLVELIAIELQLPLEKVRSGVSLRRDLGMDSVAALNILFAAEEAFDVHVPEGELEHVDDVDAIFQMIEQHQPPTRPMPAGKPGPLAALASGRLPAAPGRRIRP